MAFLYLIVFICYFTYIVWLVECWPSLFTQDGWILAKFFFCVFMDFNFVLVHKHAKKGQYPAILSKQAWSIKVLLYGIKHQNMINALQEKAHILGGQDSSILPVWVANHSMRFGSSCLLTELKIIIVSLSITQCPTKIPLIHLVDYAIQTRTFI